MLYNRKDYREFMEHLTRMWEKSLKLLPCVSVHDLYFLRAPIFPNTESEQQI